MSYGKLWRARIRLMRPGNAAMAAVAVFIGMRLAGSWPSVSTVVGAGLAAFLITSFGNVLNDILDASIDRKAHPERPIPSGAISAADARGFSLLLVGFGLLEAYIAAGVPLLAFALVNAGALALYEFRLKRMPFIGNLAVGALVASTLAFGALANGELPWTQLWWMMAMMALTNTAREVLKDIQDMGSDAGRRTLPQVAGAGVASWTASICVGIAVGLALVLALQAPPVARALLSISAFGFVLAGGLGCWEAARGQRALKLVMALALVAFAAFALGW